MVAFEALSRNWWERQWKERSVTSFTFSHPVGIRPECALQCIELICTIVANNDHMACYVHCSWNALEKHTCSSIICTSKDSFKNLWCIASLPFQLDSQEQIAEACSSLLTFIKPTHIRSHLYSHLHFSSKLSQGINAFDVCLLKYVKNKKWLANQFRYLVDMTDLVSHDTSFS